MAEPVERSMFDEWVKAHARGTLNAEVTVGLAEVVEAVSSLQKAGKLVIELTVEPAGSSGRTIAIGGKVTVKKPLPAPEQSIFYVGAAGSLHRDDPYQHRLPGVPYADTAGVVKVVDAETGEVKRVNEEDSDE